MPVGSVRHLVQFELLKLMDQPLRVQRRRHLAERFPMSLGVLHAEVLVTESCAPLLEPQSFGLVEIHENGFTVQMLYVCTVIEVRP
ncbi:hypothetical protein EMIT0232MI5_30391 [Pseudomonas sp. IT-232MI5]